MLRGSAKQDESSHFRSEQELPFGPSTEERRSISLYTSAVGGSQGPMKSSSRVTLNEKH